MRGSLMQALRKGLVLEKYVDIYLILKICLQTVRNVKESIHDHF